MYESVEVLQTNISETEWDMKFSFFSDWYQSRILSHKARFDIKQSLEKKDLFIYLSIAFKYLLATVR